MDTLLVAFIIFFAVFVQAASGFGLGLVAMPLLTTFIGLGIARPLLVLIGMVMRVFMMTRYREQLTLRAAWRLIVGAVVGIPVGFFLLQQIDSRWVEAGLGVIVTGYGIYGLIGPRIPALKRHIWAYSLGFASGVLSGAYNVGGPPIVIYAASQRWSPERFKGNLQGFTLVNGLMVISIHFAEGNYTGDVWAAFLLALPATLLGLYAGFKLDDHIDPAVFRRVVLVMLIILGLTLVF